ncbi:MAG: hypothetical protein WC785_06100 [Tatlockia sp.]|jgi:hypothetical protein
MKKFLTLCFLIIQPWILSSFADNSSTLRIAIILKNNNEAPYTSERYINFYKQGIDTAKHYGKSLGLSIVSKYWVMVDIPHFSKQVKEIKEWEPDLVIGPNFSNAFLLLRDYFKDILVLSAYANDQSIASLPSNFYTLNPLNKDYAQAVTNYIGKKYPSSGVTVIVDESCKSCYSLSQYFASTYINACPANYIKIIPLEKDAIETNPNSRIFEESYENKIILMLTTTDDAVTLIPMLSNHVRKPLKFVGGDSWGSSIDSKLGSIKTIDNYETFHIIPRSVRLNSAELDLFMRNYKSIYKQTLVDNITYAVFSTINSVLISVEKCSSIRNENMKDKILRCYLKQLRLNPTSFRPNIFIVEKFNSKGTKFIDTISSEKKIYCNGKTDV